LHTQGSDFNDAMANASEAIDLDVEGLRENGRSIDRRSSQGFAAGMGTPGQ